MNATLRGDRGRELARRVLAAMEEHAITPTPDNYAVWIAHMAGEAAEISKAFEDQRKAGQAVDDAFCAALYTAHLGTRDLSREVLSTGERMEAELADTITELQSAGRTAKHYGETLQGARGALLETQDTAALHRLVEHLHDQTQTQLAYARRLEQRLEDSSASVSQLKEMLADTRREAEEAQVRANTDALTGIANRLRFNEALNQGVSHSHREDEPLSLVLVDIDHFKRFNDTWGHPTGDQIIRFVAKTIEKQADDAHVVARYGGEEFAVVATQSDLRAAAALAERVRTAVEAKQLMRKSTNESLGNVTVSIGVAALEPNDTPDMLLSRADRRLYASKRQGRNRVTAHGDGEERPAPKQAA